MAQGSTFTIWLPIRQDGSGVYPDEPDRALAAPHPSSSEDEDYAVPASRPQPAASKGGAVRWGESHGPRQHIQAWKQIYHTVSLAPHNRDSTYHHSLPPPSLQNPPSLPPEIPRMPASSPTATATCLPSPRVVSRCEAGRGEGEEKHSIPILNTVMRPPRSFIICILLRPPLPGGEAVLSREERQLHGSEC